MTFLTIAVFFLFSATSVSTIFIDTCNCSQPIFKGTIDLSEPDYCSQPEPVLPQEKVLYKLITRNKDPITWLGYACTQWISQKEISTNFLYSHDTIYTKQMQKVSAEECWRSAQYPQTCENNPMLKDGNTLRCLSEPEGEAAWMLTKQYKVRNCITQIITLSKECHECRVTSPFGIIANSSD